MADTETTHIVHIVSKTPGFLYKAVLQLLAPSQPPRHRNGITDECSWRKACELDDDQVHQPFREFFFSSYEGSSKAAFELLEGRKSRGSGCFVADHDGEGDIWPSHSGRKYPEISILGMTKYLFASGQHLIPHLTPPSTSNQRCTFPKYDFIQIFRCLH